MAGAEEELVEENLVIPSGPLCLAGRLHYHQALSRPRGRILILPPHPFLGGAMDNNVVRGLAHYLARSCLVVRFDVRGLGTSDPDPDLDMQMEQAAFFRDSTCPAFEAAIQDDCGAACDFALTLGERGSPLWLVGYSFGTLPALHLLATRQEVAAAALIAPPLTRWSFPPGDLATPRPKAFFIAEDDFAAPQALREALLARAAPPVGLTLLPAGNDHFFIGQEENLARLVGGFLLGEDSP